MSEYYKGKYISKEMSLMSKRLHRYPKSRLFNHPFSPEMSIPEYTECQTYLGGKCFLLSTIPVSKFMCNSECQGQSRIFINITAPVRLTHTRQMRQTQGFTGTIHASTNVLPAKTVTTQFREYKKCAYARW